jgi:SPP1 gp7 family putative phage head morphogenesis protein
MGSTEEPSDEAPEAEAAAGATASLRAIAAGEEQARTEEVAALLERALREQWNQQTQDALESALDSIRDGEGEVTEEEIQRVLGELSPFLSDEMQNGVTTAVIQSVSAAYTIGQENVDVEVAAALNVTDRRVQNFLSDNALFWIGNHYEQQVQNRIQEAATEVIEDKDGVLPRREAAEKFREKFRGEFDKSTSYWRLLSNDVMTKSREFGRVEGFVKAGVEELEVDAVLDSRTSAICRAMDGTTFQVSDAVQQRDRLVAAEEPQAVKEMAPWPTETTEDGETVATYEGEQLSNMGPGDLAAAGIILPPYHGNCRSRVQGVT